ncbi:dienelactone hydrolase family protein [Celeribacter indicus]|uniref:Putative carboxymethylenebutenolidase n=1 Tax=Celeribacter indicus TaxID=1208324 RepID=A0A0B5DUH4_9RHOB|nr:dienelactone hydrolase family protein [Celeribacter indicus]AJE44885.1 putative carboxymethylenebutenolidase [Celeribacter indicus]SDX22760.1 carboxymethylenebutenolidase [Celeribacter indicus]
MPQIELTASDGHVFGAYLAMPDTAPRGGVIVIQEIFGVNIHIRNICNRLAAEGYVAIAPAIFDRMEPGFESGYSPEEITRARAFVPRLDFDACMLDVDTARAELSQYGKVGITGFCLGGTIAFLAATRLSGIAAASGYYGRLIQDFADEVPRCPVQLHYGALDEGIPPENYEDVRARRPEVDLFVYEGADHGFNCDRRPSFEPVAAKLAWARTMELFAAEIG